MLTVKNKRTGATGIYPKRQAEWLVSTGRCDLVDDKPEPKRNKASARKPEAQKAEASRLADQKPEGQVADDQSPDTQADQGDAGGSTETEGDTRK